LFESNKSGLEIDNNSAALSFNPFIVSFQYVVIINAG
jgi:hypothetical protein